MRSRFTIDTGTVQYGLKFTSTIRLWMSGDGPAVDSNGDIYFATGNGGFSATNSLPLQAPNDALGDSVAAGKIDNVHVARLTEAVYAADTLLELQGAPRQVIVDQARRDLQVTAFTARFGTAPSRLHARL